MKFLIFFLLPFFVFLSFASSVFAQTFPKASGYVNDFANLYSDGYRTELEQDLKGFTASTSAEVVVVTVENLQGTTVDDYAVRLFESWKIGDEKKDNGVLVLIAKEEREVRIEVGYGLEGVINDARAGRIIRDVMIPAFKNNDYEGGTTQAVSMIQQYIRGETVAEVTATKQTDWSWIMDFVPFMFFGVIYLGSFLARTKGFYAGGIIGGVVGVLIGVIMGQVLLVIVSGIILAIIGMVLDFILSRNYEQLKAQNKSTDWWGSRGGFLGGGGSSSGGGFGGFGGGSSGGGGASGKW